MNVVPSSFVINNNYYYQTNFKSPIFKGNSSQNQYKNPIDMKMEYLTKCILGTAINATVGFFVGSFISEICNFSKGAKIGVVGACTTIGGVIGFIINSYHAKVNGFIRKKQMDVFVRERSAATTIAEKIDKNAKSDETDLNETVDQYLKFQVANKGSGAVVLA